MAEGKFVISLQNKLAEGLDGAKRDLSSFESTTQQIGKSIERAFTLTAIVVGLKKLGEAAFDCYKEFGEMDRTFKQLKIALDGNETSYKKATSLIEEMTKVTLTSKDEIEKLVAELATLGKSDADIEKITKAAVNLSNVTGKDLNASFLLINGTYEGTVGKLGKLLPEIGNLTKEQLASGGATDLINTKFGELSAKLAGDNIPQKMKNLKDSFSELKESIGGMTQGFFSPLISGIQSIVDKWNDVITTQATYAKNSDILNNKEVYNQGNALKAAVANAKIDQDKFYESWRMSMLTTPGLNKMVGGQATPIYTPKESYEKGIFAGILGNYFQQMGNVAAYSQALDRYTAANPGWDKARLELSPSPTINPPAAGKGRNGGYKAPTSILDFFIPMQKDDFYLFQQGLADSVGEGSSFSSAMSEALVSDLTAPTFTNALSAAYAGAVDGIGGTSGISGLIDSGLVNEIVAASGILDQFNTESIFTGRGVGSGLSGEIAAMGPLDAAMEGMVDAVNPVTDTLETLNTNLVLFEESLLVNYAPPKTQSQLLSEAYGGNVDGIGVYLGTSSSSTSSGTLEASAFSSVLSQITKGMKGAFDSVKLSTPSFMTDMLGPISTLLDALGPIGDILMGMNPILALLIPIIEGFVAVLGPAITSTLEPFMDVLTMVGTMLGQALLPILDALFPFISLLANILMTVLTPVIQLIAPILTIICSLFQFLSPILVAVAKMFTVLMAPVEWVADMLTALGKNMAVFIHNLINGFIYDQQAYVAFTSDAFTSLQAKLDAIDALGQNNGSISTSQSSASTASTSASYRTQSITMNFYQNAPIVGSDGMREFARIIRGEFVTLGYMGT